MIFNRELYQSRNDIFTWELEQCRNDIFTRGLENVELIFSLGD
jgi:hypothetical protein